MGQDGSGCLSPDNFQRSETRLPVAATMLLDKSHLKHSLVWPRKIFKACCEAPEVPLRVARNRNLPSVFDHSVARARQVERLKEATVRPRRPRISESQPLPVRAAPLRWHHSALAWQSWRSQRVLRVGARFADQKATHITAWHPATTPSRSLGTR